MLVCQQEWVSLPPIVLRVTPVRQPCLRHLFTTQHWDSAAVMQALHCRWAVPNRESGGMPHSLLCWWWVVLDRSSCAADGLCSERRGVMCC